MDSAIRGADSPKAAVSSSYVPEWMKRGRPLESSVLIAMIRAARMSSGSAVVLSDGADRGSRATIDKVSAAAGATGARIVGGGFGGHVLGLMPPDTQPPPGALEVEPGPGARIVR